MDLIDFDTSGPTQ